MIGDVAQTSRRGGAAALGARESAQMGQPGASIAKTTRITRRGMVTLAAVGVVSGCSGGAGEAKAATGTASPAPGAVAKDQAAKDSAALLAKYDGAAVGHPTL